MAIVNEQTNAAELDRPEPRFRNMSLDSFYCVKFYSTSNYCRSLPAGTVPSIRTSRLTGSPTFTPFDFVYS